MTFCERWRLCQYVVTSGDFKLHLYKVEEVLYMSRPSGLGLNTGNTKKLLADQLLKWPTKLHLSKTALKGLSIEICLAESGIIQ